MDKTILTQQPFQSVQLTLRYVQPFPIFGRNMISLLRLYLYLNAVMILVKFIILLWYFFKLQIKVLVKWELQEAHGKDLFCIEIPSAIL